MDLEVKRNDWTNIFKYRINNKELQGFAFITLGFLLICGVLILDFKIPEPSKCIPGTCTSYTENNRTDELLPDSDKGKQLEKWIHM